MTQSSISYVASIKLRQVSAMFSLMTALLTSLTSSQEIVIRQVISHGGPNSRFSCDRVSGLDTGPLIVKIGSKGDSKRYASDVQT